MGDLTNAFVTTLRLTFQSPATGQQAEIDVNLTAKELAALQKSDVLEASKIEGGLYGLDAFMDALEGIESVMGGTYTTIMERVNQTMSVNGHFNTEDGPGFHDTAPKRDISGMGQDA